MIDDDEQELWAQLTQAYKPLKKAAKLREQPVTKIIEINRAPKDLSPITICPGTRFLERIDAGMLRLLKSGRKPIEAVCDLHGLTQKQAYTACVKFISDSYGRQYHYVLMITGKGKKQPGTLYQLVPQWLAESECVGMVVGHHRAAPKHGGEGALYVQIRRKRNTIK